MLLDRDREEKVLFPFIIIDATDELLVKFTAL